VTIDVDTDSAAAAGGRKGADLIRRTNGEAADAVARALRLRNLSGNIVVDFIRDGDREAGSALLGRLIAACADDPVPVEVLGFTRLGLVEVTRRRRTMSLPDMLTVRRGDGGVVRSPETLAYDALRRLHHAALATPGRPLTVRAQGDVVGLLRDRLKSAFEDTKTRVGVPVALTEDEAMPVGAVEVYSA